MLLVYGEAQERTTDLLSGSLGILDLVPALVSFETTGQRGQRGPEACTTQLIMTIAIKRLMMMIVLILYNGNNENKKHSS